MAERHRKFVDKRMVWLLIVFGLLYLAICGRLFYIQVLNNEPYQRMADRLRVRQLVLKSSRGTVYDRVGRELAVDVPACSVYAHPCKITDKDSVAKQLAVLMNTDECSLAGHLSGTGKFVYIGRQLSTDVGNAVRSAKISNVGVLEEQKRSYPSGSLAAHILGLTNVDGTGIEGIERSANKQLAGRNGYLIAEVDSYGRVIPESRRGSVAPEDGNDVTLTIDAYLQHVTEEALLKSVEMYSAKAATAVVLDPHTGEILALANLPTFNPNERRNASPEQRRNRALTDLYEPGSTLKAITVAAGLEEGIRPTETVATCSHQGMAIGKRRIRCSLHAPYMAGHGAVDSYDIIRNSCNIGAASVALQLGPDKLHSYMESFGLIDKPGSGLAGEVSMGLGSPEDWAAIRLANIGFGQGIAVSVLQMADAYAVLANGGKLMQPQIIREVRKSDGTVVRPFSPKIVRQVISKKTANEVTKMLVDCVDEGTGKTSKVEGYTVAGKTGSAQKASTTSRGYAQGKYVASFMGYLPANNPRLVICVVVDEPRGSHWGATVAAPVFQEIGKKAMWYLRVPPDKPDEFDVSPNQPGLSAEGAQVRLGAGRTG